MSTSALVTALSGIGCVHDLPEKEAEPDVVLLDTQTDQSVKAPSVTVLVDGVDVPADLSCLGTPRPPGEPLDGGPDTAPGDTGTTDAAADTAEAAAADTAIADTDLPEIAVDIGVPEVSFKSGDAGTLPTGTLVEKEIELIAFGTGGADKLPGQTVDVYWHDTFTRAPDVLGAVSDSNGIVKVVVPEGLRVGYHVRASALLGDFYGLDDLHVPTSPPDPAKIRWQGVTNERFDTLALAITGEKGYELPPQTGVVAMRVLDCQRRYVQYASVVLRDVTDDPAGKPLEFVKCGTGLCLIYLSDNELPAIDASWTSRSSLVAMVDVPSNRKLRAVAIGTTADGTKMEIGHRDLEVKEGAITSEFIEPNNP